MPDVHAARSRGRGASALAAAALALALPGLASAQQAGELFRQSCASCHTIGGGRLTGPDLKDVTSRKDRAWLEAFVQNPRARIDAGDPYALELQRQARGVVMPTVPGMTPEVAKRLIDFIEQSSASGSTAFAGGGITDRPFTPADAAAGLALFEGSRRLAKGAPPCFSCHTLGTAGALGGGALGPDLTRVYERLGGRQAVGAWLSAPGTPTMSALLRDRALQPEEIVSLLAAVEDAARRGPAPAAPNPAFVLLGLAGMGAALAVLGRAWRWRLRAVRRPMVHGQERGEA
jgi:cytochrome c2